MKKAGGAVFQASRCEIFNEPLNLFERNDGNERR